MEILRGGDSRRSQDKMVIETLQNKMSRSRIEKKIIENNNIRVVLKNCNQFEWSKVCPISLLF